MGSLAAALVFVVAQGNQEQPAPAPAADTAELANHLKEVNARLKSLEQRSRLEKAERQRLAARTEMIAQAKPAAEKRRVERSAPEPGAAGPGDEAPEQATEKAGSQWIPPAPVDGHVYDDGVIVDMNPDYPAAKDPIPASAQSSQDIEAELRAAFPQGCPSCSK